MREIATFVTDFADQAVMLPIAIGVFLMLALADWRRGALAWAVAIGGTLASVLLLKLTLVSCAKCFPEIALESPSGHTASATAIYGGLLALGLRGFGLAPRWIGLYAVLIGLVIGTSRLVLGVHSVAEVVVGCLVGLGGATAFAYAAGPPPAGLKVRRVLVSAALVLLVLHGLHMPAEAAIRRTAFQFLPLCGCV